MNPKIYEHYKGTLYAGLMTVPVCTQAFYFSCAKKGNAKQLHLMGTLTCATDGQDDEKRAVVFVDKETKLTYCHIFAAKEHDGKLVQVYVDPDSSMGFVREYEEFHAMLDDDTFRFKEVK